MIKAIFFDFGGVLLQHMDGLDHPKIEAAVGVPEKTLWNCLYRESRYLQLHVGQCTFDEWIASVREAMQKRLGEAKADELFRAFQDAEHPLNPDMMSLVERLREGGYQLGIISNTIPGLEERLREQFDIADLFHVRIGSGDAGVAKPDEGIYRQALEALEVDPGHSVFTDDVEKFAVAARNLGMHGFHFRGYEGFVADLRSVGVDV